VCAPVELARDQILAFRRRVGALDERLAPGPESLRRAAWAGLSDSMPRGALLSIHARVAGVQSDAWQDPSLVQLWGPRYSAYVVAAVDRWVFSLGRLPEGGPALRRAEDTAERLDAYLAGRRMPFGQAGRGMGLAPNTLRYGAATGRLLIRWDGARQPTVWTVPPPDVDPGEARKELLRRYLHVFGPGTAGGFARWAGVRPPSAQATFAALAPSLLTARTPVGEGWILDEDEPVLREPPQPPALARLLPSGDAYFLLQGADRELLVPDPARRAELWTPRVWPGALLVDGQVAGVWRRAEALVSIQAWRTLTAAEREAVEAEAASLPLADPGRPVRVAWSG
jgi:hypothetical protein